MSFMSDDIFVSAEETLEVLGNTALLEEIRAGVNEIEAGHTEVVSKEDVLTWLPS